MSFLRNFEIVKFMQIERNCTMRNSDKETQMVMTTLLPDQINMATTDYAWNKCYIIIFIVDYVEMLC